MGSEDTGTLTKRICYVRVLGTLHIGYGMNYVTYKPGDVVMLTDPDVATIWCLRGWAVPEWREI